MPGRLAKLSFMYALLLWLCLLPSPALSSVPDAKAIGAKLEARYHGAQTLQATFLERYSEGGQLLRTEAGNAYFRRPGKMRWEYESPEKNIFLVDGKTAWFYVPADHTVTRAPAKQSSDWRTPVALLAGEMKLSRICARVESASSEPARTEGDAVLYCPLRGEGAKSPATDEIYLEVAPNGDLARVLFRERGGIEVEFRFTGWQRNPALPDSFFRFTVPLGVAIVDGDSSAQPTP